MWVGLTLIFSNVLAKSNWKCDCLDMDATHFPSRPTFSHQARIAELGRAAREDRTRTHARAAGMVDCVWSISDRHARLDALYAELNANPETCGCWFDNCAIGVLADGRIAIIWPTGGIAEVRS
jgi:hypothetical protein